ncbi:hypothetical protein CICLE_v10027260mg [Citrus x clementina]|uniref:Uncharacterized protein n=1 Tax=Citrus clementina TaxID=85681 RepID=V4UJZ4_CITCL|nr:hypothetical protein CICLE_v10027260mg [Citrus x clementina]
MHEVLQFQISGPAGPISNLMMCRRLIINLHRSEELHMSSVLLCFCITGLGCRKSGHHFASCVVFSYRKYVF